MNEILIAGGGPAGAAAAIAAWLDGFPVRLFDRKAASRRKLCGEFLSPHASEILAALHGRLFVFSDSCSQIGPTLDQRPKGGETTVLVQNLDLTEPHVAEQIDLEEQRSRSIFILNIFENLTPVVVALE